MIVINNEKAIEVAKNKIRVWRENEFKKNDLDIQNALKNTPKDELKARVSEEILKSPKFYKPV